MLTHDDDNPLDGGDRAREDRGVALLKRLGIGAGIVLLLAGAALLAREAAGSGLSASLGLGGVPLFHGAT